MTICMCTYLQSHPYVGLSQTMKMYPCKLWTRMKMLSLKLTGTREVSISRRTLIRSRWLFQMHPRSQFLVGYVAALTDFVGCLKILQYALFLQSIVLPHLLLSVTMKCILCGHQVLQRPVDSAGPAHRVSVLSFGLFFSAVYSHNKLPLNLIQSVILSELWDSS